MDREGVPLVGITFADGSSDTLVLWKFDSNLDGHFIGHLENEPDACVGMVNHPEYIEFTIELMSLDLPLICGKTLEK